MMKRRIFLDTNIIIDYLSKRIPFGEAAKQIFTISPRNNQLCISALSVTTIYYVLKKHFTHPELLQMLDDLQQIVEILPTDDAIISAAIRSEFKDFEDAVQYYTAMAGNVSVVVTRNPKDFVHSIIPVYTPIEFLQIPYWVEDSKNTVLNEPEIEYREL